MTPQPILIILLSLSLLAGCAGVKVNTVSSSDYLTLRRGDVLTTGQLSASARSALQVVGVEEKHCLKDLPACRRQLTDHVNGLGEERRLSAMSELWLKQALDDPTLNTDGRIDTFLESARYAYAYLFMTKRSPAQRALEDRQTQLRDYYNFSVQQAVTMLFQRIRNDPPQADAHNRFHFRSGRWKIQGQMINLRLAQGRFLPEALIPASSLSFAGLRNQYRREGLGAELVAATDKRVVTGKSDQQGWSETPFPAISLVARFPGDTLEAVLQTDRVELLGYDPYRQDRVTLAGTNVPLAANFTSGYGLWLARSGFARQSLMTLVGRGEVLERPHLYLLQPYDPDRRIIIMLHGLASSPEAWINVANEVLGDETLRRHYQIWQIYYPTNSPIGFNLHALRQTIDNTLSHFDPQGTAEAGRNIVLIGHSMGGVLSRLLVCSTDDQLWNGLLEKYPASRNSLEKAKPTLEPYLNWSAQPQVSRAVFIAAPHRGTPFAENRLSRWAAALVKLPVGALERFREIARIIVTPNSAAPIALDRPLNSIDNLSSRDPFIIATRDLPISAQVHYHSIIGNDTPDVPLRASSDGVVPYSSAHLPDADSERVITSGHSVQETPEAILEIRRILHEHLQSL